MPERVGIPGFRRGRRYVAISGTPEYFNLYEADSPEMLAGQDYLNRLNAPTAWTQRVVPSFRNVARSICRVAFTNGVGSGGVMLTLRFAIDAAHRDSTIDALRRRVLPPLVYRKGIAGVHLCLADEADQQRRDRGDEGARRRDRRARLDRADRRHLGAGRRSARPPTISCRRSRRTAPARPSAPSTGSSSRVSRRRKLPAEVSTARVHRGGGAPMAPVRHRTDRAGANRRS